MVESYGSNVGKHESSGGPNDKGWRKETQALLKPPHLKQVFWRRKNKPEKIIRKYFVYSTLAIYSL